MRRLHSLNAIRQHSAQRDHVGTAHALRQSPWGQLIINVLESLRSVSFPDSYLRELHWRDSGDAAAADPPEPHWRRSGHRTATGTSIPRAQ